MAGQSECCPPTLPQGAADQENGKGTQKTGSHEGPRGGAHVLRWAGRGPRVVGSMKKIRTPRNGIGAENFNVFRIGAEGKGATKCPLSAALTNTFENSYRNLLDQLAIASSTAALVKF